MAKYKGAVCRLCRREGTKLFFKGTRCYTDKCAVMRRPYAPGQHGKMRVKLTDYGIQLREKQKVKKIYGLLEKQFKFYFQKAERNKGVTGEKLLESLEKRLDNVIFRLMYAMTRREARQMVANGNVYVNSRKVNRPSYQVKVKDVITLKCRDKRKQIIKEHIELTKDQAIPKWLIADHANFKGDVVGMPERKDVAFPIREQLIVELYSK